MLEASIFTDKMLMGAQLPKSQLKLARNNSGSMLFGTKVGGSGSFVRSARVTQMEETIRLA